MKVVTDEQDGYTDAYPMQGGPLHSLRVPFLGLRYAWGTLGDYFWTFSRETGAFRYEWAQAGTVKHTTEREHADRVVQRIVASLFMADDDPRSIFHARDDDTPGRAA